VKCGSRIWGCFAPQRGASPLTTKKAVVMSAAFNFLRIKIIKDEKCTSKKRV
jgi:hypothetical protein